MIEYKVAESGDIEKVLAARYETIRAVCGFNGDYEFSEEFRANTEKYFREGNQTTVLAMHGGKVVGCASLCYIWLMPTFDHPYGKRAHIMNVYTDPGFRRMGIGSHMMNMLIEEARRNGATELTLDATEDGRPLYEKCGFTASEEGMTLNLSDK